MRTVDKQKWMAVLGFLVFCSLGLVAYHFTDGSKQITPGYTTSSTPIHQNQSDAPTVAISPATSRGQVILALDGDTITFAGLASGTMFYEGTFPAYLQDQDNVVLAQGLVEADGDWMTEDEVPFTATLHAVEPISAPLTGTLVLQKDNPSGLPANDLTVIFSAILEKK